MLLIRVAAVLLGGVAVILQGCGGGSIDDDPSPSPSPDDKSTTGPPEPVVTTQPPTPSGPTDPPMTPSPTPMPPTVPEEGTGIRSIVYNAVPNGAPLYGKDTAQLPYRKQWGAGQYTKDGRETGRDDLQLIKNLGANYVEIAYGLGLDWGSDHEPFLDHALEVGLGVIVGFNTGGYCNKNWDCSKFWKDAAEKGLKQGFAKNGSYHPAVKMIKIMNQFQALAFGGDPPPTAPDLEKPKSRASARTTAVLSATDGFLQAEAANGIDSSNSDVTLTASWEFAKLLKFGENDEAETTFAYGFEDVHNIMTDPSKNTHNYKVSTQNITKVYENRWIHSVSSSADWAFIKREVDEARKLRPYGHMKWAIDMWTPKNVDEELEVDLNNMLKEAQDPDTDFAGLSIGNFHRDYHQEKIEHDFYFFEQGVTSDDTIIDATDDDAMKPCHNDFGTYKHQCLSDQSTDDPDDPLPLYCLTRKTEGAKKLPVDLLAKVWGGSVGGVGMCDSDPWMAIV